MHKYILYIYIYIICWATRHKTLFQIQMKLNWRSLTEIYFEKIQANSDIFSFFSNIKIEMQSEIHINFKDISSCAFNYKF